MATTIGQNDLDNNQNQQPGQNNNSNQPGTNNQPPVTGPQQTGQQQSTIQSYNPNKQQGSGYTNIQRIVQANQGNNLGKTVGSGIQKAGQQVSGQLGQAQQNFQQQTNQNQFNTDANNQLANNVLANPDQYVDQTTAQGQQGNQFQKLLSGVYSGPQTLSNIQQLQGQASDVAQMNQALGSAGGRTGLLQRFVGGPQYNSGEQTLDSLLLGKSGGQDLSNARLSTAGLGKKVSGAEQGAEAQAQLQTGAAQALGQQLQGQFGGKVADINTALTNQATAAQTARDTQYKQMLSDLQSGKLNQKEAAILGLTNGQEITSDMLSNIGNYVSENPLQASAQNIASAQDYAKLNALRQLGGQNISTDTQGLLGQYSGQDANAGAFAASQAANPDQAGFNTALNSQLQQYHSTFDPALEGKRQSDARVTLLQQRAAAPVGSQQWNAIQAQIQRQFPEVAAMGGASEQWAQSAAQTANQTYQNTLNNLTSQYGALQKLQVNPDENT